MDSRNKIFKITFLPICILVIAGMLLWVERSGIQVKPQEGGADFLTIDQINAKPSKDKLRKEALFLVDFNNTYSKDYEKEISFVLDSMSVGYEVVDVTTEKIPNFKNYETVILATPDFAALGDNLLHLFDWVNSGGKMLSIQPIEPTPVSMAMASSLGIEETQGEFTKVSGLKINTDFMIGGKGFEYNWPDDNYISAISLRLSNTKENIVHVQSSNKNPLMWETKYGQGRIVISILDICGKETRGYFGSCYSLLQDAFAYPVINSSVFYIDDFPAPLPSGYNEYITKFYNRDVRSFYVDVWWPDMISFAKKHNIKYTGLLIQNYNDDVKPPFDLSVDKTTFTMFGNSLINLDGEIGYHGYNHQPLCYNDFDFLGKVDYNTWPSANASQEAFSHLTDLAGSLFPDNKFQTYVPPSNILSPDGREMLTKNFPEIKVLSGLYQVEDYEFVQEFNVSPDGIINFPRIVAGTEVQGFEKWMVLNELNFHYVNSHFFHPDDVLDPERGAELGWQKKYSNFNNYVNWLYDSAPNLRSQTSIEAGKSVQRYDSIAVHRELTKDKLSLKIENFTDENYMIVRIRDGKPGEITGGVLEQITSELYILTATSANVDIKIVR